MIIYCLTFKNIFILMSLNIFQYIPESKTKDVDIPTSFRQHIVEERWFSSPIKIKNIQETKRKFTVLDDEDPCILSLALPSHHLHYHLHSPLPLVLHHLNSPLLHLHLLILHHQILPLLPQNQPNLQIVNQLITQITL